MNAQTDHEEPDGATAPGAGVESAALRSERRRGRHGRRRWILGGVALLVVAAGVIVAFLVWPDPPGRASGDAGLAMEPSDGPQGPVRISGVDAPLVWVSSEHVEVVIDVVNDLDEPVLTRVWWLLAEPDDPDPWKDPVVQPEPVPVLLDAGVSDQVKVPLDLGLVTPDAYRLSLWVHTYDESTETWVHADGRALQSMVRVAGPSGGVSHIGGTSDRMWIQSVTGPRVWRASDPATVTVSVANAGADLSSMQVWWFLSPTASDTPWEEEGSVRSETMSGTADPGNLTDLAVPMGRLPAAGTYRLTVWLHQQESSGSVPRDGVLVDREVTVIE